jgi:hypothetical protein
VISAIHIIYRILLRSSWIRTQQQQIAICADIEDRKATIIKNVERPWYHGDAWDTLNYYVPPSYNASIPRAIVQTLRAMTSLESLHLNVLRLSEQQGRTIQDLLKEVPELKLKHLTIRADSGVVAALITKCLLGELKSLDTDEYSLYNNRDVMKFDKLERLRVHLHKDYEHLDTCYQDSITDAWPVFDMELPPHPRLLPCPQDSHSTRVQGLL